jgi:hypothetical protein
MRTQNQGEFRYCIRTGTQGLMSHENAKRSVSVTGSRLFSAGWVGFLWSKRNSLINAAHSADRPEPLFCFAPQY